MTSLLYYKKCIQLTIKKITIYKEKKILYLVTREKSLNRKRTNKGQQGYISTRKNHEDPKNY